MLKTLKMKKIGINVKKHLTNYFLNSNINISYF